MIVTVVKLLRIIAVNQPSLALLSIVIFRLVRDCVKLCWKLESFFAKTLSSLLSIFVTSLSLDFWIIDVLMFLCIFWLFWTTLLVSASMFPQVHSLSLININLGSVYLVYLQLWQHVSCYYTWLLSNTAEQNKTACCCTKMYTD